MSSPRAVVIPFGVPADAQGLGLGLAALVHGFIQLDGQSIALAQLATLGPKAGPAALAEAGAPGALTAGRTDTASLVSPAELERRDAPVEVYVAPEAWRELASRDHAPDGVELVVTGSFDPPRAGGGALQLLAFDGRSGNVRARIDAFLDGAFAGRHLLAAFTELCSIVGSDATQLSDLGALGWDALESVLRAERCALHDPFRGGPHDRLAAMLYLGRAMEEAPSSRFIGRRLAVVAVETAMSGGDPRLAEAALRALGRAVADAPEQVEVLEATAALELRVGRPAEAEVHLRSALSRPSLAPADTAEGREHRTRRSRGYALLSEALRAQGLFAQAREAVHAGATYDSDDSLLETERGLLAASEGDLVTAAAAFRRVLAREPGHASAFVHLSRQALASNDVSTAQALVDLALSLAMPHPDVLRRAIQLAQATEPEGLSRASRLARLTRALLLRAPEDVSALLTLARALSQLGEGKAAAAAFQRVEGLAAGQPVAAESSRLRFAIEHPAAAEEMEGLLRAAYASPVSSLATIAARSRRFAQEHDDAERPQGQRGAWVASAAAGIAARRQELWTEAREAFETALHRQPGVASAHIELVGIHVALGEPELALAHAEVVRGFGGDTAQSFSLVATAHHAAGRRAEARAAIERALVLDPTHAPARLLAERIAAPAPAPASAPARAPSSEDPPARSWRDWFKKKPS